MSYPGYVHVYVVTMGSGVTLSSGLNLSKPYHKMYLHVPTMASGSLKIHASYDNSTYNIVTQNDPNNSTDFSINSAATQRVVPIPVGYQYMKIENTSGATDVTTTFRVICSD